MLQSSFCVYYSIKISWVINPQKAFFSIIYVVGYNIITQKWWKSLLSSKNKEGKKKVEEKASQKLGQLYLKSKKETKRVIKTRL